MQLHFFIFTAEQRTAGMAYNDNPRGLHINPRAIDTASPGVGININGLAADYEVDDEVELTGTYVIGYNILTDPDYLQYAPDMVAFVLTLPMAILDTDVIFLPEEDA